MVNAIEVIPTWRDQASKRATNTLYVPDGLTLAQYQEGLAAAAALLDDVSGAVMEGMVFNVPVDISALTGNVAASTSDVEDVGAFQFRTVDNRPVQVNAPGIIDTLSPSGTDDLDQVQIDVAAFISMFEDGLAVTGGTIIPCDVFEDDIIATVYAREEVKNSGSGA